MNITFNRVDIQSKNKFEAFMKTCAKVFGSVLHHSYYIYNYYSTGQFYKLFF